MHRDRIVGVLTTILGAAVAYMTSQLARDVIEALVDVFEAKEGGN